MVDRSSRLVLALAALAFASPASAAAPSKPAHGHGPTAKIAEPPARRAPAGRSVGSPTEGHLIGGAHLNESAYLRVVPVYSAGDARWGLEALVGLIDRAAKSVRRQFPDAVLSAGHLSRSGGGEIDRHASHESGRDADIGFYVKNQKGKAIYADHFVAFAGDGTAPTWPGAQFDDAKNWAFVASIAGETQTRVSHIFVALPLRTRLMQYAEKINAPHAIRVRASELMAQPRGSLPHDDHFHVRIGCPAGMDKCIEHPLAKHRSNEKIASAHAGTAHGKPAAPPKSPRPEAPAKAPPRAERSSEEAKDDSFVPSLAPIVPGLDSAVISAPFGGARIMPKPADASPLPSDQRPIDDPDGVFDPN